MTLVAHELVLCSTNMKNVKVIDSATTCHILKELDGFSECLELSRL